jgi:hypothetical protein
MSFHNIAGTKNRDDEMTGHFEKGTWIEDISTIQAGPQIPLLITLESPNQSAYQVDRVAEMLNLTALVGEEFNGEMVLRGASGKSYRILDFLEFTLRRMKP